MKKLVAILMVSLMVVSIVGCKKEIPVDKDKDTTSSSEESTKSKTDEASNEATKEPKELVPEEGAELTYWALNIDFANAAAAAFEEKYGVPVTVEQMGFDAVDKLLLDGPTGNGPDLCWGNNDVFSKGYDSGVFLEIDSTTAARMNEELHEVAVKTVTRDGKMYGIPMYMETTALVYNKDIVPEPVKTFEEIFETAKEFNNPTDNKFYYISSLGGYAIYPMLSALGFELFGPDGIDEDNPGFDSPEFLEGLKFIASLKEIMPISSEDLKMSGAKFIEQNFIDGNTIYMPNGPWAIKSLTESGVNFGIAPLPTIKGKTMKPFATVRNTYVSYYTEYPIAAQMFAEFLASEEGAELLYSTESNITARKDTSTVAGLCDDENLQGFIKQFPNTVTTPGVGRISYYWTITDAVMGAVFDGTMTPEEGAKKAQADFEALVASE